MEVDKLSRYLEISEEIKRLKEEQENIKADIKLDLEIKGIDSYEDDNYSLTNKESIRTTYPVQKLKEFLTSEQLEQSKKETKYTTFKLERKAE